MVENQLLDATATTLTVDEFDLDVTFSSSLWISTEVVPEVYASSITDPWGTICCAHTGGGSGTGCNKTL
jgi:hypothetical protein